METLYWSLWVQELASISEKYNMLSSEETSFLSKENAKPQSKNIFFIFVYLNRLNREINDSKLLHGTLVTVCHIKQMR